MFKKICLVFLPLFFIGCNNTLTTYTVVNNSNYDVTLVSNNNSYTILKNSQSDIIADCYSSIDIDDKDIPVSFKLSGFLITIEDLPSYTLNINNATKETISFTLSGNKLKHDFIILPETKTSETVFVSKIKLLNCSYNFYNVVYDNNISLTFY